jgi:hypothetical protein
VTPTDCKGRFSINKAEIVARAIVSAFLIMMVSSVGLIMRVNMLA